LGSAASFHAASFRGAFVLGIDCLIAGSVAIAAVVLNNELKRRICRAILPPVNKL
jgi:hypothetical protein